MGFNRIEEHNQRPFWQIIGVIFISIVITNNLITLCNYIDLQFIAPASLLVLVLMTFICARIVISMLTAYRYTIFENHFSVERCLGKKRTLLFKVSTSQILDFHLVYRQEGKESHKKNIKKYYYGCKKNNIYALLYQGEKEVESVWIKPDRRIINFMSGYDKRSKVDSFQSAEDRKWLK